MDTVSAGARAHGHHRIPDTGRRSRDQVLPLHQPEAHRVHDGIALVPPVEHDFAADVRDPDAIAIIPHTAHDAAEEVPHSTAVEVAEAERVEHRNRSSAHGENVAQDPSHAGRGALVGLDRRRVVVRLDLEGERVPIADVDHPGVLAGALDHPGSLGRQ